MSKRVNPFSPRKAIEDLNDERIEYYFCEIDAWIDGVDSTHFNTDFYDSLKEQWNEYGRLTEKQVGALENIFKCWVDR